VVFDTNVVLSALVFSEGSTALLRAVWLRGDCVPLASTTTTKELIHVLAYPKFRLNAATQQELLADYLPYTLVVDIPEPPPVVPDCRDAFDLPFLYLATAGLADILVTGDADLQILANQVCYRIMSPSAFLRTF